MAKTRRFKPAILEFFIFLTLNNNFWYKNDKEDPERCRGIGRMP